MATREESWYLNSLPLKFIFAPFKAAYTLLLIIFIIFICSFVSQTYFHQPSLVSKEWESSAALIQQHHLSHQASATSINQKIAYQSHRALYHVFFKLTTLDQILLPQQNTTNSKYFLKNYFETNNRILLLHHFNDALKIVSIRLGNIVLFLTLIAIFSITFIIDGLVQRAIRQKNASRESAGIYHRAKYWRTGIIWSSIMTYLCLPIYINPFLLIIPSLGIVLMLFLQMKYLKKYL